MLTVSNLAVLNLRQLHTYEYTKLPQLFGIRLNRNGLYRPHTTGASLDCRCGPDPNRKVNGDRKWLSTAQPLNISRMKAQRICPPFRAYPFSCHTFFKNSTLLKHTKTHLLRHCNFVNRNWSSAGDFAVMPFRQPYRLTALEFYHHVPCRTTKPHIAIDFCCFDASSPPPQTHAHTKCLQAIWKLGARVYAPVNRVSTAPFDSNDIRFNFSLLRWLPVCYWPPALLPHSFGENNAQVPTRCEYLATFYYNIRRIVQGITQSTYSFLHFLQHFIGTVVHQLGSWALSIEGRHGVLEKV